MAASQAADTSSILVSRTIRVLIGEFSDSTRVAHSAARMQALEMPSCTVIVQLYNKARTFFQKSVLEGGQ